MDRLTGRIQRYAWGDPEVIPALQGRPPTDEPEAELWLGAHPVAPARLEGEGRTLAEAVDADPESWLGPDATDRFAKSFPYLLKVLAAAQPLSIQSHPTAAQAREGFAREEAGPLGIDHPERVYRDDQHKPELLCALTPFHAKCGFRPLPDTRELVSGLATTRALESLADHVSRSGTEPSVVLAEVLRHLLTAPEAEQQRLVAELVQRCTELLANDSLPERLARFEPELTCTIEIAQHHPGDIGVVVALLLNHVTLQPGEAVFLSAGNLHSYLRGAGIEIMANSDNVVRGGLTGKHIDVEELLRVVDTTPRRPSVQRPGPAVHHFHSPVPEFTLSRLPGPHQERCRPGGPEIVLVTAGSARLRPDDGGEPIELTRGEAAVVAWSDGPYVLDLADDTLAWRATVGAGAPGAAAAE